MSQQRNVLTQQVAGLHVHVAGECPDGHVVAGVADVAEVAHPADVDQHAGRREAQLHQRQQAVATGEELGLVAVLADEADGLLGGTGADVVECCGDHLLAPCAALIAFQTLCGLAGIGMSRTPRLLSASMTAFMTAGADPMVPASPMPFTPSWLVGDGVTV